MSEHHHDQVIPRSVLWAAAAMIVLTIVLGTVARRARLAEPTLPARPPIAALNVSFQDRPDGALVMLDADSGRELAQVPPQSNGFVRGVLRGMYRTRKLESMGRDGGFRLAREADGRLSLQDPRTGRLVYLESFGPSNTAAFADLLAAGQRAASGASSGRHD